MNRKEKSAACARGCKNPVLTGAAAALGAGLFLIAPGMSTRKTTAPFTGKNFAHRGLHNRPKTVPENSLAAFAAAADAGYGIELDVQLSSDGEVVVFHDNNLNRVCGVDKRVCDVSYGELSKTRLCGTEETIPLFSEVLRCIRGRVPLIVELKTGKRNRELCQKTLRLINDYRGDVCIESFDPRIVAWFRFHAPRLLRGQLSSPPEEYSPDDAPKALAFAMGNCLLNFLGRPQFIAYKIGRKPLTVRISERLGAMRFCWTSHEWIHEKRNDGVIFEFYRPGTRFKN